MLAKDEVAYARSVFAAKRDGLVSQKWLHKSVLKLSDDEIEE